MSLNFAWIYFCILNLHFYKTGDGTKQFWGDVLCSLSSADGNSETQGTCLGMRDKEVTGYMSRPTLLDGYNTERVSLILISF